MKIDRTNNFNKQRRIEINAFIEKSINCIDDICLIWPFALAGDGYPIIRGPRPKKETIYVSRLICEKVYGPPPTDEHEVAHSCGKSSCLNKRHLRWATHSENELDKRMHGTDNRGDNHYQSKRRLERIQQMFGV
jgi:hypothetical protein